MSAPYSETGSRWVAGVDGYRDGWVVVLYDRLAKTHTARTVGNFAAMLDLPEAPSVIAIDVPIGLLSVASVGGRECERRARRLIRGRASSVFSAPARSALDALVAGGTYPVVSAANRGEDGTAPGLSQQAFAILPKIREVDEGLETAMQRIVCEVHPELCFAEAGCGHPMTHPKKSREGRAERIAVLERHGFVSPLQLLGPKLPTRVKADDLLDACIACWTADRVAAGTAIVIPDAPPTDSRGLRLHRRSRSWGVSERCIEERRCSGRGGGRARSARSARFAGRDHARRRKGTVHRSTPTVRRCGFGRSGINSPRGVSQKLSL
jgi:predicted RNase H-like nuclease